MIADPSPHTLIHNSPRGRLTDELETDDTVHDALQPDPDGFDARLAVAFARQEAAEHGHQSQDLVESISLYTTSGFRCKLPIFLRRWQDGLAWGGAEGS